MAQTPGTISGQIMGIYNGANRLTAMKGVNLDLGNDEVDMNNCDTGDFNIIKPARRNWSASGNGHFQFDATHSITELFDAWKNGTLLVIKFTTGVTGDYDFTGSGYIDSLKANFPDHENSTFDFSIKGATDMVRSVH